MTRYAAIPAISLLLCAAPVSAWAAEPADNNRVGAHYSISPTNLAKPYATPGVANSADKIARPEGAKLAVPKGFTSNLFADDVEGARWMTVAPNGDVFVARSHSGTISVLRDTNGDGKADQKQVFASGFARPHGLAFHDGALYVGDTQAVWRLEYKTGALKAGKKTRVTTESFGGDGGHWTRDIAFGPRGTLFVAIGSGANVATGEPRTRATVQAVTKDGKLTTFASGLRNPVGIAFYPGTDLLFVVVNERDGLGDDLVPDYFTRIQKGQFFGWPYAYIGAHPDPDVGEEKPDMVAKARVPDLLFQSHSAPLGLMFYTGKQFPADYNGDAFVALHGSWNATKPTGYKVVRVKMKDGKPVGGYENFATGFWARGTNPAKVWGRPVGLAQAKDGSLLIADDAGGAIWRVSYTGK